MNESDLEDLRDALEKLEEAYDPSEIEVGMDAVASALQPLAKQQTGKRPSTLVGIIKLLPLSKDERRILLNVCTDLGETVESANYDEVEDMFDEEDNEEAAISLKDELCEILTEHLEKWENELPNKKT